MRIEILHHSVGQWAAGDVVELDSEQQAGLDLQRLLDLGAVRLVSGDVLKAEPLQAGEKLDEDLLRANEEIAAHVESLERELEAARQELGARDQEIRRLEKELRELSEGLDQLPPTQGVAETPAKGEKTPAKKGK